MKPAWKAAPLAAGAVVIAAVGLVPACAGEAGEEQAAAYAAVALDGDSIGLADLRGDVVLLNVWATWCAPCRAEIPVLQDLHERRASEGLRVVGVSVDDPSARDEVRRFADDLGMMYAIWLDPAERVASAFRLHGIPSTIVIGRDGRERWRTVGPIEAGDPALGRELDEALAAR